MANESNLKSGRKKWKDILRRAGKEDLAVSYFVPRYLARIIPVCSVKSEGEGTRQFGRGTRRVWPYRQNRVDRVDFS